MHNGMFIALIVVITILFSLYLLNEHLKDLKELYHARTYEQGWLRLGVFQGDQDGLYHQT
jgi:hypothetical protein